MPKSTTFTLLGMGNRARRTATSTPKASSPKNIFPIPPTSTLGAMGDLAIQRQRFNFFGSEEETVPRLPQHSEIPSGIVLEDHGKMDLVLEIALNGLDYGGLALERHVHDIRALLRP